MFVYRAILSVCICLPVLCSIGSAGTFERVSLEVADKSREYLLFTPDSYNPDVPMPLVFGIHGYTVDATTHEQITEMNAVAESRGVLAAYPQATGNNWLPGFEAGDAERIQQTSDNNLDYLVAVYEQILDKRNVNQEIVGISGLSQGATIGLSLVNREPELFSSIVTVAGLRYYSSDGTVLLPEEHSEIPSRPISRLHIHGTADPFVPDDGGPVVPSPFVYRPVIESVTNWASGLGADQEPEMALIDDISRDGLTSESFTWEGRSYVDANGLSHTAVTQYINVLEGGHNWPGDFGGWPSDFQPVTRDFSASEMAIDFILEHPRAIVCEPLNSLLGDFDGDGNVGFTDFLILSANFGADVDEYVAGDANCDGAVAFDDFLVLSENFGQRLAADNSEVATLVPEPTGFAIAAPLVLFALLQRRRSRR